MCSVLCKAFHKAEDLSYALASRTDMLEQAKKNQAAQTKSVDALVWKAMEGAKFKAAQEAKCESEKA